MKITKKYGCYLAITLALLATLDLQISTARAQGTAFTYQGRLNTNAVPANGFFDFEFSLYTNAAGSGSQIGSTITRTAIGVTNGLFATTLDFGPVFTGNDTWLAIDVRSNGVGSFTPLTPLQELYPTPYAVFANTASNVSGTVPAAQLNGTIPLGQLPPTVVVDNESGVTLDNMTIAGTLSLPLPAVISAGGSGLLYADGNENLFAGLYAGNESLTGYGNTGVGYGALYENSSGSYNVAQGFYPLFNNQTGSFNVGAGYAALYENSSGSYNVAQGFLALYLNQTGSNNVALGASALENNTTANNNTAVGYGALYSDTTGFYNTALGLNAGINIATGNSNIDIGSPGVSTDNMVIRIGSGQTQTYIAGVINGNGAGLSNVSASQLTGTVPLAELPATVGFITDPGTLNFFAGQYAGNSSLSGGENTGVGYAALTEDTTGYLNVADGYYALAFNSTGYNDVAVGAYALEYNTTGNNNTGTGFNALSAQNATYVTGGGNTADGGYALTDDETGYNNTAVGYQALPANTSGFDNVGIGVDAFEVSSAGFQNTAVGTYAFQLMTSGTGNTGLGVYAGYFLKAGSNNIYIGSYGSSTDNNVIRIGEGQTETYIDGNIESVSGDVRLDDHQLFFESGSDTYNGLGYYTGLVGFPTGDGPLLYGFNGGSLGSVGPTEISLSWDYLGDVWVSNNLSTASLTIRGGADLAEPFKITSGNDEVPQGSVMVIDEQNPGQLKLSSRAYDTRVAGVLSGANGINPGIQMQQQGLLEGGKNVALTGRVYVQADASNGAIEPGDLLTTSDTPGHAMKVSDHAKAQGAILGKAMTGLSEGKGMVLVLVTLQ